ncbi:2'-5' RNA ligase family protein [Echinicola sp. CAU 1574]|uniref:2'-5' RNA ligase family protein n=1 Tax=Echinicola arenosa TaxID=2774144 RepID=A0ABR9AML3_9BACT|nr:2'-5' RNA ligase family protein [Echinicola arenosa]MBD8490050.1 2'-5' RNA ligase family protein [Echinicola arenosa]
MNYLLVLNTGKRVESRIQKAKYLLGEQIGPFPSLNSKAHMTLMAISTSASYAEKIFDDLSKQLMNFPSYAVNFSGIAVWEHQKVIYACPSQEETLGLGSQVAMIVSKYPGVKVFHSLRKGNGTAHTTIARGLTPWQFEVAKNWLLPIPFEDSFKVKEIVVLKKVNPQDPWEKFKILKLKDH